ncbi:hypothetical protein [Streptomyces sp. 184]|uniref:hypothetical protein n=1 Tax=Streptomyces sp. 184 TaxID=1827526 RepID=UPI00389273AA
MGENVVGRELRQAERWLRRAGGPHRTGGRARRAWRRLEEGALHGEPAALAVLIRTARDPRHPRTHQARSLIADRWAVSDDPALRQIVLETHATATASLPRLLRSAALQGPEHLRAAGRVHWTAHAPTLLQDPDDDVRNAVTELCRTADVWAANRLWPAVLRPSGPYSVSFPAVADWWLFDTLLAHSSPPPAAQLELLWDLFLRPLPAAQGWRSRGPGGGLLPALTRWGVPAAAEERRELSRVVVEPDTGRLLARPATRRALIEAAGYAEHPLAEAARERILAVRERPAGPGGFGEDSGTADGASDERPARGALSLLADFADFADELCAHALDHDELLHWCVTHRFTPSPRDPARRAAFLLRTGRAHDDSPPEDAPPGARQRAARWGDGPGLAEIVLGAAGGEERARRVEGLTDAELAHLTGWLDDEGRLPDLWQLVRDLPLARGHRLLPLLAARHAGDGHGDSTEPRDAWRPADEAGRRLLALLRAVDPGTLAAGLAALARDWPAGYHLARIRFRGRVNDLSFAPDVPLLAVATSNRAVGVIDLHRGELAERYDGFWSSVGHLVHLGGGAFVAAERTSTVDQPSRLLHCAGGRSRVLREWPGAVTSLAGLGAGRFVAGTRSGHLLFGGPAGAGASPDVVAGAGAGAGVVDAVPVPELAAVSVAAFGLDPRTDWPRALASDPYAGRLAVCGRRLLLTAWDTEEYGNGPGPGPFPYPDASTSPGTATVVVAEGRRPRVTARAVLAGPTALAVYEQHRGLVEVFRPVSGALRSTGSVGGVTAMTALPGRGQLATVDPQGGLHLLDAVTLAPRPGAMPQPPDAPGRSGRGPVTSLHASPDGGLLAAGYAGGVTDLYDVRHAEIPSLATRPLAYAQPAHADALLAALDVPGTARPTREVLRLLLALLSYRFPRDGDAATLSAGGYDIEL